MQSNLHAMAVNDDTTNDGRARENRQDIDLQVGANTLERERDHEEGRGEKAHQDQLDGPVARYAKQPEITRRAIEDQSDARGMAGFPFYVVRVATGDSHDTSSVDRTCACRRSPCRRQADRLGYGRRLLRAVW